jgi:hypothetical protein
LSALDELPLDENVTIIADVREVRERSIKVRRACTAGRRKAVDRCDPRLEGLDAFDVIVPNYERGGRVVNGGLLRAAS